MSLPVSMRIVCRLPEHGGRAGTMIVSLPVPIPLVGTYKARFAWTIRRPAGSALEIGSEQPVRPFAMSMGETLPSTRTTNA
jgi:hypothetical protein